MLLLNDLLVLYIHFKMLKLLGKVWLTLTLSDLLCMFWVLLFLSSKLTHNYINIPPVIACAQYGSLCGITKSFSLFLPNSQETSNLTFTPSVAMDTLSKAADWRQQQTWLFQAFDKFCLQADNLRASPVSFPTRRHTPFTVCAHTAVVDKLGLTHVHTVASSVDSRMGINVISFSTIQSHCHHLSIYPRRTIEMCEINSAFN